jgi:hypothetical protein
MLLFTDAMAIPPCRGAKEAGITDVVDACEYRSLYRRNTGFVGSSFELIRPCHCYFETSIVPRIDTFALLYSKLAALGLYYESAV